MVTTAWVQYFRYFARCPGIARDIGWDLKHGVFAVEPVRKSVWKFNIQNERTNIFLIA